MQIIIMLLFMAMATCIEAQVVWITGSEQNIIYQNTSVVFPFPKWDVDREYRSVQSDGGFETRSTVTKPYDPNKWQVRRWYSRTNVTDWFSSNIACSVDLYRSGRAVTNAFWYQFDLTIGLVGDLVDEDIVDGDMRQKIISKMRWHIDNTQGEDPRIVVFHYSYYDPDGVQTNTTFRTYVAGGGTAICAPNFKGLRMRTKRLTALGYTLEVPFRSVTKGNL